MAESNSGLGALGAYMLGRSAAESANNRRSVLDGLRANQNDRYYQNWISKLVKKGDEFLEHIEWQKGIMDQRKARIAELEAELAARNARVSEWERYGEVMERNHSRLRAWSNDAEVQLQRYHALYGPLPADKTSEK